MPQISLPKNRLGLSGLTIFTELFCKLQEASNNAVKIIKYFFINYPLYNVEDETLLLSLTLVADIVWIFSHAVKAAVATIANTKIKRTCFS